eukprot:GHVL01017218.1.p1 GENE.GHVL01017218.1~~GHVL01017218.1.p1  ORF type:complete len:249 (+),score=40.73 GHVL01017218.1:74-820(+)
MKLLFFIFFYKTLSHSEKCEDPMYFLIDAALSEKITCAIGLSSKYDNIYLAPLDEFTDCACRYLKPMADELGCCDESFMGNPDLLSIWDNIAQENIMQSVCREISCPCLRALEKSGKSKTVIDDIFLPNVICEQPQNYSQCCQDLPQSNRPEIQEPYNVACRMSCMNDYLVAEPEYIEEKIEEEVPIIKVEEVEMKYMKVPIIAGCIGLSMLIVSVVFFIVLCIVKNTKNERLETEVMVSESQKIPEE